MWRLDLRTTSTYVRSSHVQECPDIGPLCEEGEVPPYRHRNTVALVEGSLDAELGLGRGWAFSANLPVRWAQLGIRNETLDGEPYPDPPDEGIHHRNETLVGPGDPVLSLVAGRTFGKVTAIARAGVSFPFGWTNPNPFAAGEEGDRHQHFQIGAGIFQPVLGADAIAPLGPVTLSVASGATLALYENRWGLRPSSRAYAALDASRRVADPVALTGGLLLAREFPERWDEAQPEREGNLGRTDVLASARVRWRVRETVAVTVGGAVPLYTDAVGSSIDYPGTLMIGISLTPAVFDDDDDE